MSSETFWGTQLGYTHTPEVQAIFRPLVEAAERAKRQKFSWYETSEDFRVFDALSIEDAKRLVELGALLPDMNQNDSPSTAEFIRLLDGVEGVVLHGYWCTMVRSDERISIEGAKGVVSQTDFENIIRPNFEEADEFDFKETEDGCVEFRAWWD